MSVILLVVLIILLILSAVLVKTPSFFSVSFVSVTMLAISSLFLIIDSILYDFDITLITVLVLFGTSSLLLSGEIIGLHFVNITRFKYNRDWRLRIEKRNSHRFSMLTTVLVFGVVMSLIVLSLQIDRVYRIGEIYSAKTIFEYMAFYRLHDVKVQLGQVDDDVAQLGNVFSFMSAFVFSILCYSYFLLQFLDNSKKQLFLVTLLFLIMIMSAIMTGGRTNILVIILTYFLIKCYAFLLKGYRWRTLLLSNIHLKIGLGLGFVFMLYMLSYYRANGNEEITFFTFYEAISRYLASSIVGLDYTLGHSIKEYSKGLYTLPSFYLILEKLNIIKSHHSNLVDQFFSYRGERSNVYTALAKPYWDFGLIYIFISRFFLGLFFGILQGYIYVRDKQILLKAILLVMFFWPVYMYAFDDLFIGYQQFYFFYVILISVTLNRILKKDLILSFSKTV